MTTTLEELWNGNLAPSEKCGVGDPEIKDLIRLMQRNKEDLMQALAPQQFALFEKYADCSDEYVYRMTAQAFCEGFSLASKLLTESLSASPQ